jgi:eukaryotic-like serine/threonine-protein kinase
MNLTFIEQLGSGGFGTVDRVRDDQGREYARKTFSINQPMDQSLVPNVRKRFVREAKLQSGIKHRNVVSILHTSLSGDNPWYLMPVAESTLSKDIAQHKTLGGDYKLAIADIIAALEDMHSMQMYHRDLKPQNVLRFLNDGGNKAYYAVSDFGFAS